MRLDKIDESNIEDMLVALTTEPPKELTNQPTDSATNADIEKREAEAIKRHRKRVKAKVKKAMSNSSANRVLDVLSVMLGEAYRRKIIKGNPCKLVRQFTETKKPRKILSLSEVHSLFSGEWSEKWDDEMFCVMNKLAACTGMRIGEIVGLRGEFVFEKYINVCGQHTRFGYGDTKTHKDRVVPLPAIMRRDLAPFLKQNGAGYVFSKDEGKTPISRHGVTQSLCKALAAINIDRAEQMKRGLTFHAWRHFFNTTLRMANVTDSKVNSVTGHLTDDMNDWYTQYNNLELEEVYLVQESILGAKPQIENHSV
jgi:integrase